ncbi:MAG TPA: lipoprotein [Alphaproteobacteria bacterium]|nr:lipoprotein [Alphaproteobacteria bacterium]
MKKTITAALLLATLAGCAPPPPPTPLPYRFVLADITDGRLTPEQGGTDPLYDMYPFDTQAIAMSFSNNLVAPVFGAREAKLHLKVTHYQATTSDGSWAVSIAMEGYAQDDSARPRTIGIFNATCNRVEREGFALDAFATDSWQQKSLKPLTPDGRNTRMFGIALNNCTRDLARQFGASLAAKGD